MNTPAAKPRVGTAQGHRHPAGLREGTPGHPAIEAWRPASDVNEASARSEQFGVSRTPVREALIRLASEGLITLLPNQGARVSSIELSDIAQMFEMLELTQRAVNRWCAARRKPDGHSGDAPPER